MSVSVLTRGYSDARDGANKQGSVLTAAAVRDRGIKRLFSLSLSGDTRGAEAQPLIVPGVALAGADRRFRICRDRGQGRHPLCRQVE